MPPCRRMPKAIVAGSVTLKPWARPATRSGPVAPASLHPSQPAVLVSELPLAVTLTGLLHVTLAGAGLGPGLGAGELGAGEPDAAPPITAFATTPFRLASAAASTSG